MSTKASFFQPKFYLVALFLAALILGWRIANVYTHQIPDGRVKVEGEVTSVPYLTFKSYNFRVGKYFIETKYLNLDLGDRVVVEGDLKEGKIKAISVKKLPLASPQAVIVGLRTSFREAITKHFPDPQGSLLAGITLGQNLILKDFKDALVATGTIHVVVVSGYNIALVAGFFLSLAPYLGRKKTSLLAIVSIVCYTILVGLTAPTIRAAIMGTITLIGILLGRKTLGLYLLILSAWLMLVFNPLYLIDISFQLSFLATLGVMVFTSYFDLRLKILNKFLREGLATTLAAQVLVVPVLFTISGRYLFLRL